MYDLKVNYAFMPHNRGATNQLGEECLVLRRERITMLPGTIQADIR